MPENLDSRLLAASEADRQRQEEAAISDRLRQERMATADRNRQKEISGESKSYRQAVSASRLDKLKEQVKEKVAAPVRQGTSWLLRTGWGLMLGFYTFIFGVFLADIHWAGNKILGKKIFCNLGDEWPGSQLINASPSVKSKKEFGEKMLLATANAIAFIAIIFIVSIFVWLNDNLYLRAIYKGGQIVSTVYDFIGVK